MIEDYSANEDFEIIVQFEWIGSPRRDFTVMVYSADGNDVEDDDGDTNMLHADGQTPSEFDYIVENLRTTQESSDSAVEESQPTVVTTKEAVDAVIEEVNFVIQNTIGSDSFPTISY